MPEFKINTERVEPNIVVISLEGFLDTGTADKLSETFKQFFGQSVYKFVVDLSELDYIGSAGVGVFISILDILEKHKGTIVFIHPNPRVKEVFKIFKLSIFYTITTDRASALKELQALTK